MIRKSLDTTCFFSRIIPASALMLFCILAHLVVLHLQSIRKAIEQLIYIRQPNSLLESKRWYLNFKLKKYYLQVSKTIDIINQYFGIPLLSEVVYIFVGFTNCSMFVLIAVISGDSLLGLVNGAVGFEQMMHLFLITSFSDKISNEVPIF